MTCGHNIFQIEIDYMDCLKKSQTASWDSMLSFVSKAVIFLDNITAECLHWMIGVDAVFNAGAIAIKDFNAFEYGDNDDTKAVFVLNNLLCDTIEDTICDIVKASQFNECTIIYCTKPNDPSTDEETMFEDIKKRIEYYLKDKQARCVVQFLPLMDFSICSNMFITPAFSHLFPMLTTKVCQDDSTDNVNNDIRFEMLPTEIQQEYKLLIAVLDNLCERLDINEDIYCIGSTSQHIATKLAALSSAKLRRKSSSKRASLIIVDRTLDLAGPVSHTCETLADKIFSLLPRLQGHNADIAIDMSMLCSNQSVGKWSVLSPGCLAHPQDKNTQAILNTLIMSKTKEGLMEVNRHIVDAVLKEKFHVQMPQLKKIGKGVDLLKAQLNSLSAKKTQESFQRNCGLLQLGVGCLQALELDHKFEKYEKLEKMIIQNSRNVGARSPASHILNAYTNTSPCNRQDSAEDLLRSLVFLYSLHGNNFITRADQEKLKQVLTGYDPSHQYHGSKKGVDDIFNKLSAIGMLRDNFKTFRYMIEDGNDVFPSTYKPFLHRLAEQVVDISKPDLPDLQHRSTGLRDRIKTSFRLFMNVSKPHPSDHPLLIIFVIGGVTCSEVKIINEVSTGANQEILLGSTCLLKPNEVVDKIFSIP